MWWWLNFWGKKLSLEQGMVLKSRQLPTFVATTWPAATGEDDDNVEGKSYTAPAPHLNSSAIVIYCKDRVSRFHNWPSKLIVPNHQLWQRRPMDFELAAFSKRSLCVCARRLWDFMFFRVKAKLWLRQLAKFSQVSQKSRCRAFSSGWSWSRLRSTPGPWRNTSPWPRRF